MGRKENHGKNPHGRRRRERLRMAANRPPAGSSPGTLALTEGAPPPRIRAAR